MGFTPAEVDGMSLWEFRACFDGWMVAHGPKDPSPSAPSDDEFWDAVHGEGSWRR